MNGTFEEENKPKLTVNQQASLMKLVEHLRDMAAAIDAEPINPKLSDMLNIVADMAEEQVRLDTYYSYHSECVGCGGPVEEKPSESNEYMFLDNDDDCEESDDKEEAPEEVEEPKFMTRKSIADEISQWFEDGMPKKEDND